MKKSSDPTKRKRVMVGSIGDCVHSLGVETFAEWMEDKGFGYYAVKLGPAVPIRDVINKIREARPAVVGVSSRLGDLHVDKLIGEFIELAHEFNLDPKTSGIRYSFGGLRPAANLVRAMTGMPMLPDEFSPLEDRNYDLDAIAEEYQGRLKFTQFFEMIVDDYVTMEELEQFAEAKIVAKTDTLKWSDDLIERIKEVRERENRPILRAHIGIASEDIQDTISDVEIMCDAEAVEIISLAPDQPSQAFLAKFVRGEEDPENYLRGQGGAPIRTKEDLKKLKAATQRGNWPMTRIYSGTDELIELAKMFEDAFNMPFPAVPIFFYNKLDGRGPIAIREGIQEHFDVIRWWAERNKPLEINDPHQWQLRNCSDDMYAFDHVIIGIIAMKMGIKNYVMQLMFDLPPEIAPINDLAKMKAAYELLEPLTIKFDFNIIKETRGGLSSFPPNLNEAKGHLSSTTLWQMYMEPEIVHVVSFPESHHEAKAQDIIESCDIVKQVFKDFNHGQVPNVWNDPDLIARKEELKKSVMYNLLHLALLGGYEGKVNLESFSDYAVSSEQAQNRTVKADRNKHYERMLFDLIDEDNYATGQCGIISADTLDLGLQTGLMQAPQITVLDKRYELTGKCRTKMVDGACRINEFNGKKVNNELERVDMVRNRAPWFFSKDISMGDDKSSISELAENMEEVVVEFRKKININSFENKKIMMVDFGSTFTKVGILDTATDDFSLNYVPTTPDDIREGLANGLNVLELCREANNWDPLGEKMKEFDVKLPCSSAKGGLKMVTVSLVKEESGFAAESAALTAGAKVLNNYFGKLSETEARTVYEVDCPEIILLAGGVNEGGDKDTQLHNAKLLAENAKHAQYAKYGVPVIYCGNQDVNADIVAIFKKENIDIYITDNVMPDVNEFQIDAANETIRDIFQTIIIKGKGFDVIEEYMSVPFLPTPRAAFLGINLLAKGYGKERGIGNIMALDIGGCTTDFYVNVAENPLYIFPGEEPNRKVKRTILKTPNAPLAYRRVEGKYGLSYNAENLMDLKQFTSGEMNRELNLFFNDRFPDFNPGDDPFNTFISQEGEQWCINLEEMLKWIKINPHVMPIETAWVSVYSFLAKQIMAISTMNNVGYVDETDTYFLQYGVNLFTHDCKTLLIGGTIYHKCREGFDKHRQDLQLIASGARYNQIEESSLRPNKEVFLDADYLISIVGGLYGRLDPERALRIIKKQIKPLEMN